MKLIFIHGRSQQGKESTKLLQEWKAALEKGLDLAGLNMPAGVKIAFPFYGDLLDTLIKQLDAPLIEDVRFRGAIPDSQEAEFRGEILTEIARSAGISDAEIQAHYAGQPHEKGPLNWEWVQSILKALDKTRFGEVAIDNFTRDVYVYLTFQSVRKQIDKLVAEYFTEEPCVVVGHSLGSIVGYNVLRKASTRISVRKYVTVGSPLGLQAVKKHLSSPLGMPSCTQSWFNAFDRRDFVALNPLDQLHFNIIPPIANKSDVNNDTDNRHGITGYLKDPVVARQIFDAL